MDLAQGFPVHRRRTSIPVMWPPRVRVGNSLGSGRLRAPAPPSGRPASVLSAALHGRLPCRIASRRGDAPWSGSRRGDVPVSCRVGRGPRRGGDGAGHWCGLGQTADVGDTDELAALGRALKQLLLASYGLYPDDLAAEVADACSRLGGGEVMLLLVDCDQHALVGFDHDDDRTFPVDGPGPGLAFRREVVVEEPLSGARRRLWVPVKDSAERVGVLGVVDDGSVRPDSWESIAALVGELIVSKSQYGDHITRRRRRGQFSLAAEMRWALLPPLTFTAPDVSIAGFLQPSRGIAGDAFDYAVTGRLASVAIFDAMGHGIEASRMANVAVGCYRNARCGGADVVTALLAVDEIIASQFGQSRFVTAQLATLDLDSGELEIVNAGHPPPLWLRAGQGPSVISCPQTRPAGLGSDPASTTIVLRRDDNVVFRTDGVVDARSPAGDFFGDERLADLIGELHRQGLPPAEILRRCLHEVAAHQNGRPSDDACLLVLRWTAPN